MKRFKVHPDGVVYINNLAHGYIDSVANFRIDAATVGLGQDPTTAVNGFYEFTHGVGFERILPNGQHEPLQTNVTVVPAIAAINACAQLAQARAARIAAAQPAPSAGIVE